MKSTIRIEYDFDTKQPVLRIVQDKQSDDLRDTMLKAFIEEASFQNSTMFITYPQYTGRTDNHIIEIRCERNPDEPTVPEKIDFLEKQCRDIIWSNSPEDLKFINDFCNILRERTQ